MRNLLGAAALFLTVSLASCTPNQRIIESNAERVPESAPESQPIAPAKIEDDIAAMKTADFNFIYVFRRKDSAGLDKDDRAFMNGHIPYEINRKQIADGGKALLIGSNFRFPAEDFKALKDRFLFEDFSKPESEIMPANSNANTR